tara:strand:- start:5825 stop:6703 length:879 start_codon:yes stop_codon:yes gene_type:complete
MKITIRSKTFRFPSIYIPKVKAKLNLPVLQMAVPRIKTTLGLGGNFKKIMGISLSMAGLIIAGSVYFAIAGVNQAPVFPQSATYDMDANTTNVPVGNQGSELTQTLDLNIGGARIESIIIDDINVGSTTITDSLKIFATGSHWIEVDELLIDNLTAPDFILGNSEIYSLVVKDNKADGNSFSPTLTNGIADITLASTRGAIDLPAISGSDYDRIVIETAGANAQIGKLHIKNLKAYDEGIVLNNLKVGQLTIQNSSIGDGDGIDSADFIIQSDVKIATSTLTNNAEVPISVK